MNQGGYGPDGQDKWILRDSVIQFMNDCTEYMYHVSTWKKFLVWRYTVGSGALNRHLIGLNPDKNTKFWVYLTCKWWHNLLLNKKYADAQIETPMDKWENWLLYNPNQVLQLPETDPNLGEFLDNYALSLKNVILETPPVPNEFKVIKVSSKYPELPDPKNFTPTVVPQKPFNSTTLDLELNFGYFLADNTENFIFVLTIPKGSHVLYIPPLITAYPWEQEVLLPYGCSFHMEKLSEDVLKHYHKTEPFTRQIQEEPWTIGPIFDVDNGLESRRLISKKMTVMEGFYEGPLVKTNNKLSIRQLRKLAKEKGIKGYSKMTKKQLTTLF